MKLLVVHPGASYSTHDVYVALYQALEAQGHELHGYLLDSRIERVGSWLNYLWRKAGKPDPRPSASDVIYRASLEALERALRWEVDGALVISAMYFHPATFILMRRAGIKTGLVFTESPYDDNAQFRTAELADVCWTNERSSVRMLRYSNPQTHYLAHGYNAAAHASVGEVDDDVPEHDVVFVGSCFSERVEALSAVDWSGIDFGLYGEWRGLPARHKLRQYVRGGITDNRVALELYRRAKIGLNLYRLSMGFERNAPRVARADSLNPRAYDLAATGAFQISDARAEVADVFGDSVPTFNRPDQLEGLLRHYLADADARRTHADEARRRVKPHTYAARAAQLTAQLTDAWAGATLAKGA